MSHITRQTAIELASQHGINAEESQLFGVGDLESLCNAAIQHYIDSAALAQPEPHSDDIAVDAMAAAMKEKLRLAREKGRGGWETCSQQDLSRLLREHVEKGDPRDVANFCAFLYALGFGIAQPEPVEPSDTEFFIGVCEGLDELKRRDAAFESVRKKLAKLPRYSFHIHNGNVRRVEETSGNWIEFDMAHRLFDPVAVDAAAKGGAL